MATQPIIIIKKIKKAGHGGKHGGAWKIAYADFVTAMMAFFLLMWLLSYTDPATKQGIADYFNRPLKAVLTSGPGVAPTASPKTKSDKDKKDEAKKVDEAKLAELKKRLDAVTEQNPKLRAFKDQIRIDMTTEGVRVQIIDKKNRPMFAVGSAVLEDYTKVILDQIGATLNSTDSPISVAGHTDALQYAGGEKGYSNWELSSDRANAARRELIVGGMHENKVMQVRGLAGSVPLDKNLSSPANRRISIVILNQETVARLIADGSAEPAETAAGMPAELTTGAKAGADVPMELTPGAAHAGSANPLSRATPVVTATPAAANTAPPQPAPAAHASK